jgi:hypothetical protein
MRKTDRYVCGGMIVIAAMLATVNGALAQTTIEGGVKPYFVAGGAIAAALFLSVGGMLLRKGNRFLRFAAAAAQWPSVTGKVMSSDVVTRIERTEDGPSNSFVPVVHYVYDADGAGREGRVIKAGLEDRGYPVEKQAREHAARYPAGSAVAVRYDPQNPASAVLELGQIGGAGNLFAGALMMLLGAGAVAFTVFSSLTPGR